MTLLATGDATAIADVRARGGCPAARAAVRGRLSQSELSPRSRDGGKLVLTDSNRRRVVNSARLRLRIGPTLTANEPPGEVWPSYDLFPGRGSAAARSPRTRA